MAEIGPLNVSVGYDDAAVTAGVKRTNETINALDAAFAVSVKASSDFEKQISAIAAVRKMTKRQARALRKRALRLGKETSFSAHEAAEGMRSLIEAGNGNDDVMAAAARAVLDLSEDAAGHD